MSKQFTLSELSEKRYLTNVEAQSYLNLSATTLWRKMRAGEIAYARTGLRLLFDRHDLDDFVRRNRVPASGEK